MQPLIGGILIVQVWSADSSASSFLISQAGAAITTPLALASSIKSNATSFRAPDRERTIRFLAFRSTIHRQMLLPRPPKPPAMT